MPLEFAVKPQKWIPTPYMKRAVRFLVSNFGAALFLDPGLRKTSITLKAISALKKEGIIERVLVVAPLRVCYGVWPKEVEKWLEFNHLRVSILHGDKKDAALKADADIYVINPDGLKWLLTTKNWKILRADTLVIDESTMFKHTNTARFKLIKPFLARFARRWILTGTPVPNGLLDLFGQMLIVDLGKSLGPYITHYRMEFFNPKGFGGFEWEIKDGADKKIYKRIKPISLRLDAKDYIELPEMIVEPIWVELPPDAREIYDDMEDVMIAHLTGGQRVTAVSAGAASKKCEQIANGGLYYPNFIEGKDEDAGLLIKGPRVWDDIHLAKIDAMMELRDSLHGGQLLIAYDFAHDLSRIKKALLGNKKGFDFPYIGGGVSPARGVEIEAMWNAGRLRDLPAHPASMGHGLNLQYGGNHIIWHSPTWNLEHWDQYNRRILRSGSPHKHVFVYPVFAKGTVDEAKWASIQEKDKTQSSFLNALKSYIRKRR